MPLSTGDPIHPKKTLWPACAWITLLGLVALINLIDMPAMFWPGDPNIEREETRSILAHGKLAIDPAVIPYSGEPGQTIVRNPRNGEMYSKYGVMNSIMALLPMWIDRTFLGGSMIPVTNSNLMVFNLWNIALSLLLAAVLMKLTGLYTSRLVVRVLFVLALFYGTYLWYYLRAQGSEIYQTLFYAAFFLFFITFLRDLPTGAMRVSRLHLAWLCVGVLAFTRMSYVFLIPLIFALSIFVVMRAEQPKQIVMAKRLWTHIVFPPLVILSLLGWVNYVKFGAPWLTGYHVWHAQDHIPSLRIDRGLYGLLLDPQYSAFLYFPPLGFSLLAIRQFFRRFFVDAVVAISIGVAFFLFIASIPTWAGEWTYGPRYVLFALPILSLPFILVLDRPFDRPGRPLNLVLAGLFAVALIYSGYLQYRVNSVRYFAFQEIRRNLEDGWPEPVRAYIQDHHVGRTIDDLVRHRDNLDATPIFAEFKQQNAPPEIVEQFRSLIRYQCTPMNHYWWQ